MKTIKEGLDEAYKLAGSNAYFGNGFNAGIKFAERWIPIKEELPGVDKDDMWNDTHNFSKKVITKNNELTFENYEIQAYNEGLKAWQMDVKVTHWRPIERS